MCFCVCFITGFEEQDTDLFLCDTNTCKFDGECLRIGDTVTCICDFKVGILYMHLKTDIAFLYYSLNVCVSSVLRSECCTPLRHRASLPHCRPSCITQVNSIICLLAPRAGGICLWCICSIALTRSAQCCLVHLRRVTLLSFLPLIQLSAANVSLGPCECFYRCSGGRGIG